MEELPLPKKQVNTIKITYFLSVILIVFASYTLARIIIANDFLNDFYANVPSLIEFLILFFIIFWPFSTRKKLIAISLIILPIYHLIFPLFSFPWDGSVNAVVSFVIHFAIRFVFIYFFWLFLKNINGKNFEINKIKKAFKVYLILLILPISFLCLSDYLMEKREILYTIVLLTNNLAYLLFFGFIAYKGMIDKGFYKYFIEAHPMKIFKH